MFAIVVIVITCRILRPSPFMDVAEQLPEWLHDGMSSMYGPFGVAHLTWATFVYRFNMLFIRLRTGAYFFPFLLGMTGVLSVIITAIYPLFWLISIGFIALLLAVKLIHISYHWSLPPQARGMIRSLSFNCFVMASIMCAGGVLFCYLWNSTVEIRWNDKQQSAVAWFLSAAAAPWRLSRQCDMPLVKVSRGGSACWIGRMRALRAQAEASLKLTQCNWPVVQVPILTAYCGGLQTEDAPYPTTRRATRFLRQLPSCHALPA